MKVLAIRPGPHFSVLDVHNGWCKGLREQGCDVVDFNFDDQFEFFAHAHVPVDGVCGDPKFNIEEAAVLAARNVHAACYEYEPDVVLVSSGFYIPPSTYNLLRSRGHKVVLLHTESPYEDDRQTQRARFADLNIVNDPTNLDRFPDGSIYVPHAYDPDVHHPREPEADHVSGFCFVGTAYPSRVRFFEQVEWAGIDVAFAGNWQGHRDSPLVKHLAHDIEDCIDNADAAKLYAATKASVNLYRKEASDTAEGWAMGPREVELAACGTFFLREPRPEGDDLFPMLPVFLGPDDFERQLRWWLAHDEARTEAAEAARTAVAPRTFAANAARLLDALA